MTRHSQPVWTMAKEALIALGGEHSWVRLRDIVEWVRTRWVNEDVVENTIRCQVRVRCVNGHPGHDDYPDKGKLWRTQPTFVWNRSGSYRLYNADRDYSIYVAALAEHGEAHQQPPQTVQHKKPLATKLIPKPEPASTTARVENVLDVLEACGMGLGFKTQREWPVPMGRIDLVWYVELPIPLPQTANNKLPVVGFELETGWRTRKHIKGDILNLQVLHPTLGILVQQTAPEDDPRQVEGLIRNTRGYIQSLGASTISIWTDEDIAIIASSLKVPLS